MEHRMWALVLERHAHEGGASPSPAVIVTACGTPLCNTRSVTVGVAPEAVVTV